MDNEQQCSRRQYHTSIHVSTPSSGNTVGAAGESTEVLQRKLDGANARLTSLSLRLASTVDALDTQAKAADRDAALAAEDKHALTRKLAILEAKYLDSEYERQDMQLAITELMDKISRPQGFEILSPPSLQLTSFLDRPSTPHVSTGTLDSTVESYASNVIHFLTSNLKTERVERGRLASEAEVQIRHLRTQIARREAEMQALLIGKKETEPSSQIRKTTRAERANINLVLESQNRTLEMDIEELKHQLRAQAAKLQSHSASATEKAGKQVSPYPGHFDTIPSAIHSPTRAPEALLSILDHQKGLLEHQMQTLTATRQQLREQAVSLQLSDDPVQPSAQAPDDSKSGFEGILLIEEECIRLLESERAARREILDFKDKELYYLQVISDLQRQVAELRARLGGRQSDAIALEARDRHLSFPVSTLDIQGGSVGPPLQSLSPRPSSPVSTDVFGLFSLPATTFSYSPHPTRSLNSDTDNSLHSFMPRRSGCTQPQHSDSTILPPLLHGQRDGVAGRESGTNSTRNSLEDDTRSLPEPIGTHIQQLEVELAQARREADEGSMELRHLRAEVARLSAGSPALPSNLIEFGFVSPQDGP